MSCPLRITVPVAMTDAKLLATDVPEADEEDWNAGKSYGLRERCIKGHKIWESSRSANFNNDPETSDTSYWLFVSATNRWCLFDLNQVTRTTQASGMFYELAPGAPIDSVHVLGLKDVDSVQVRLYDRADDSLKFDGGQNAAGILPAFAGWWGYCYGPWTVSDQQHYTGLPYVVSPKVRVDFNGGADLSTQVLLLGNDYVFGDDYGAGVQPGVRMRFDRNNQVKDNDFNIPTMTSSALISTVTFTLSVLNRELDALMDFYKSYGDQVCLFTISDQWRTTQVLGKISTMTSVIEGPRYSKFDFELTGVPQQ